MISNYTWNANGQINTSGQFEIQFDDNKAEFTNEKQI